VVIVTERTARPDDAIMVELAPVLAAFRRHHPSASDRLIHRAYDIAWLRHADQFRRSGEPYITHPLAVAGILAEYGLDAETVAAAILHDTVEDTDLTLDEVADGFGPVVASLIDGVTKLDRVKFSNREEQQAATIRKMVIAMARDVRVLLIKLADRLHNIRTIHPLSPEHQQRVAAETLEIYAPLAHRLGVQEIKHEMEDRCFQVLYPKRYAEIVELTRMRAPERDAYLGEVIAEIEGLLAEHDIATEVTGRPKHPYSIYRKMVGAGLTFDEIHDLIGVRIVTETLSDCYAALGMVHTRWPPVQGRFKDYIAMPKFNLYQSLHTTVLGPDRKPLEVQIRTREMHDRAEQGIAAHWRYKEGDGDPLPSLIDLSETSDDYDSPTEFLAGLKLDLYRDEVFVLTPNGDVKTLPQGATPVDFAYSVHTEVGHRCTGARVNGRLVPLSTRLVSGDIVEVITSKVDGPSRDWLGFVRTSRAAAKIRQWFSRERREQSIASGREAMLKIVRKEGLGLGAAERDRRLGEVASHMGMRDLDSMYQAIGEGNVHPQTVLARLVRLVRPEADEADEADRKDERPVPVRESRSPVGGLVVEGMDDMLVRVARCCSPVPGDPIVGFVTVGRGVSIHRADCTNVEALGGRAERMVEVDWSAGETGAFRAAVQVEALDRPRLLRDVTIALSDLGANIVSSSSLTNRDRVAVLRFEIELSDTATLDRALIEMKSVEGVYDAYRLLPGR
jgi:GTP diphosphokinase / guanosine-3',5'-bis(diphosphate) 3'-diphosphatase